MSYKYRGMATFHIPEFQKFQMTAGTENRHELRSAWIHICTQIKTDGEDQFKKIKYFLFKLKQSILKGLNKFRLSKKFIFDVTYPDSFEWTKKAFFNIQVNVYAIEKMDKKKMNRIMTSMSYFIDEVFESEKSIELNKFADYSKGNKTVSRKRPS